MLPQNVGFSCNNSNASFDTEHPIKVISQGKLQAHVQFVGLNCFFRLF